jgi:hypothetical protein
LIDNANIACNSAGGNILPAKGNPHLIQSKFGQREISPIPSRPANPIRRQTNMMLKRIPDKESSLSNISTNATRDMKRRPVQGPLCSCDNPLPALLNTINNHYDSKKTKGFHFGVSSDM